MVEAVLAGRHVWLQGFRVLEIQGWDLEFGLIGHAPKYVFIYTHYT